MGSAYGTYAYGKQHLNRLMQMGLIRDLYYIWNVCIWEATSQQTDAYGTYMGLILHMGCMHMGSNISTD